MTTERRCAGFLCPFRLGFSQVASASSLIALLMPDPDLGWSFGYQQPDVLTGQRPIVYSAVAPLSSHGSDFSFAFRRVGVVSRQHHG